MNACKYFYSLYIRTQVIIKKPTTAKKNELFRYVPLLQIRRMSADVRPQPVWQIAQRILKKCHLYKTVLGDVHQARRIQQILQVKLVTDGLFFVLYRYLSLQRVISSSTRQLGSHWGLAWHEWKFFWLLIILNLESCTDYRDVSVFLDVDY